MRNTAKALAFIASLLPFAALGQSAPANMPFHSVYGRIGAVPGDVGPGQAIPWATILSKGLLDQIGTAQGTIPCRGASAWGPLTPGAAGTLLASGGTTVCPGWISTVPVANGGTGQSTAAAARAASGLNIYGLTSHNDSNYQILSTDRTVGTNTTLTAPRVWTLPAANSVNPGEVVSVVDYAGGVTAVNTLTIQRSGSDTIAISPSNATSVTITNALGRFDFRSDGVSKWSTTSSSTSATSKMPSDYGALCDGSTDDSTALQAWLNAIANNAFIGYVPNSVTCMFNGLLSVSSNTQIWGYGATFKLIASGNTNSGFVMGPTTQIGNSQNIGIRGLTIDGNRANQTNTAGAGAMLYAPGVINYMLQDVSTINGRGDGVYVGGSTTAPLTRRSSNVSIINLTSTSNRRNNMSFVGVDYGVVLGGVMSGAGNTTNDGPMNGFDLEPDAAASQNSDITIIGTKFLGNGNASLTGTGNTGLSCYSSSFNFRVIATGIQSDSNLHYGVDVASGNDCKTGGVGGASNGTSLFGGVAAEAWGGSGGSPGGSNTQVQFNNSSAFGGSANLTWVSPTLTIGATGTIGALAIKGVTGTVTQTVNSSAGTPTVSWGNGTGTPAVTASSPLAISGTTGNITCSTCTVTVASGATAMGTSAISSAACATVVTATATGTATTDVLSASFNGDPTAVTGYIPATAGMLTIFAYPTANTANFKVCNNTSSSITPGAITLNWRVTR